MTTENIIAAAAVAAVLVGIWQARQTTREISEGSTARQLDRQPLLRRFQTFDQIVNGGGGPAYRALLIRFAGEGLLLVGRPVSVGVGDGPIEANVGKRVSDPGGILPVGATWAIVCEDQFARRFRFLDGGARPDIRGPRGEHEKLPWLGAWDLVDATTV